MNSDYYLFYQEGSDHKKEAYLVNVQRRQAIEEYKLP